MHLCCCNWHYFILFMVEKDSTVYVYCTFFTHSSVSGHFDCFHILIIVNSTAMDIGVHVSFWIIILSGYMPRHTSSEVGLLDHMVFLFLVFWGNVILLHFYINLKFFLVSFCEKCPLLILLQMDSEQFLNSIFWKF